jgi:hypothetical protein
MLDLSCICAEADAANPSAVAAASAMAKVFIDLLL